MNCEDTVPHVCNNGHPDDCTMPDHWEILRQRPTPRVAASLDDLREGQWIAWADTVGQWGTRHLHQWNHRLWSEGDFENGIVILSDPPPSPVTVSREAFDKLAEAVHTHPGPYHGESTYIIAAAMDLVNETLSVRGTDQ